MFKLRSTAVMICVFLGVGMASLRATAKQNNTKDSEIRKNVQSIVEQAARPIEIAGSGGTRLQLATIPIPADSIQKIRAYGKRAIPALSSYLAGENSRRERVAIRLLGVIGGNAVLEPLSSVLQTSKHAGSREEALQSLRQVDCVQRRPVLKRVLEKDSDPVVLKLAQEELADCGF
jgi:hypothetical protein